MIQMLMTSGADWRDQHRVQLLRACAEYVTEAVSYDNQEQFEKAFEFYMKALDQFSLHCKYDKNPASKEMIQNKMREYMSRAEYLKSVIAQRTKTDHAGDASTAVGQKKKPSVRPLHTLSSKLPSQHLSVQPGVHDTCTPRAHTA